MLPLLVAISILKRNEEKTRPINPANIEVSKYHPITLAASFPLPPFDLNLFTAGHKAIKIRTGTILINPFSTLCVIEETIARLSPKPAPIIIPKIRAIKDHKYPGILLIKSFMS